jgi:hypothetical protein
MPIRFSCQHCGQRLRIASRKAGKEVECPKCHETIVVPAGDAEPAPPPAPAEPPVSEEDYPPEEMPLSEFVVYDDDVEWVYESDEDESNVAPGRVDLDRVSVPRSVLYAQGILLGVVGLTAFALGVLVGGGRSPTPDQRLATLHTVFGQLQYKSEGDRLRPDADSTILILPAEHRPGPNERASIEGLRPQDPRPNETNSALRAIQAMGGSYARSDDQGRYQVRVSEPGTYFVLFVSANAYRENDEELDKTDLAQIGRYVLPATDLLGDHAYHWESVAINRDRMIDHQF